MGADRGDILFGDARLCLDIFGAIHRVGAVMASTAGGEVSLSIPFDQLSLIGGGSTWNFQFWHRDTTPGGFNLSNAAMVSFCP